MVARLVQQHDIRTHQQNAGQRDAHLPAAGQCADVAVHHLLAEAQTRQHFTRPPLQRITIQLLEASLNFAVAFDDGFHLIRAIRISHRGFEFLQFDRNRADGTGPVHHLGGRAAARHLADVLAEVADGHAPIDSDLAFVRKFLTRDHPKERGLAGPIGPNEAHLFPRQKRRGGFDEENLMAVLLTDVVETNHIHTRKEKLRCLYAK